MRNEGYIFIRGKTWIRWDKVSVHTGGALGGVGVFLSGWVGYGWTRGMGGWVD